MLTPSQMRNPLVKVSKVVLMSAAVLLAADKMLAQQVIYTEKTPRTRQRIRILGQLVRLIRLPLTGTLLRRAWQAVGGLGYSISG